MADQRDPGDENDEKLDPKDPRLNPSVPYKLTVDDKRFLRSLRISIR